MVRSGISFARLFARSAHCIGLIAIVGLVACARTASFEDPGPEPPEGWEVSSPEHVALWYHGLALAYAADAAGAAADTVVVPHFLPGYAERVAEEKRSRGFARSALDERAAEFGRIFRADEAYDALEFLPLYFRTRDALFRGIEFWASAGGDPRRASTLEAARVVAFLTQHFPRARHREVLVEWVGVLRSEADSYFDPVWTERESQREAAVAAVQGEWNALAPAFETYLDYLQLLNGELFLVPALGAEGRIVTQGVRVPRAAVSMPGPGRAEEAILIFAHELVYPLAGEVVREYVAPARIRELGERLLVTRAAVRGGAILLAELAPDRVADYERLYLEAAGVETVPVEPEARRRDFEAAFPLPTGVDEGIERYVRQALAGI